jgi:RNA polymerase sigma factor (sigma-70 family)
MPTAPSGPDDEVLVRLALQGQEQARRLLVERMGPLIRARIRQRTSGQGVGMYGVDDLVQETLERLFRREGHLLKAWEPERGSLAGYCSVVARSVVTERLRTVRPTEPEVTESADPAPSAEQVTEDRAALEHLYACLGRRLPPIGWLVFMGLYADGHEPAQLATRLGRTRASVDDWHYKIRQAADRCRAEREGVAP